MTGNELGIGAVASRVVQGWATLVTLAMVGAGCAASSLGTETGNPPVVTPSLVKVVDAGDDRVTVLGQPGAVTPGGGQIEIRNLELADEFTTVEVAADGSFRATLAGDVSDDYELVTFCILEGEPSGGCSTSYEWSEMSPDLPLDLPEAPAAWSVHQTECGFSLTLPPDMSEESASGIDSCVADFEGDACTLGADAGFASDPLDDVQGATTRLGTVDGREARMITTRDEDAQRPHVLGIHFPPTSTDPSSTTLFGRCESEAARDALLPALGSVRFD